MSLKEKFYVLDQLFDLGILHISFGGGEPTLQKNLIKILRYTNKHTSCSFVSNGTFINEELCKKLKGLVSYVGISLDGLEKSHNKMRNANIFNKVINSIKLLQKHKIPVRIVTTPTKLNFRDIPRLGSFIFDELKVRYWKIMRYMPEGDKGLEIALNDEEEKWLYSQLVKLAKKYGEATDHYFKLNCPAGKFIFSIFANGDVSPCGFAPFLISGNCLETPLIKILTEGKFFRLMRTIDQKECFVVKYWRESKKFNQFTPLTVCTCP